MSRFWHKKAWQLQGLFVIPACVGLRSFLRRCDTSRALDRTVVHDKGPVHCATALSGGRLVGFGFHIIAG